MKVISQELRLSATDLSNHLSCHHLSVLDLAVARGTRGAPDWRRADLEVIRQLGLEHERGYLRYLESSQFKIADVGKILSEPDAIAETVALMRQGVDVISQGAL